MSTIYKPKKLNNFSKKNKPKNNKLNNKQNVKINVNKSNNLYLKSTNQNNINKINKNISIKKKENNNNNNNNNNIKILNDEKEKLLNEIIKKYEEKNKILIDEKIANILINNINLTKNYFFPKNFTKIFLDQKHKTNSFKNFFYTLFYSHNLIKLINQSNPKTKKNKPKIKFFNRRIFDIYYYNEKQNPRNPTILKCNTNVYQGNRRRSSLQLFGHGLTKMPHYQKKHLSQNYDLEYDYAKKAAVHVRRLEYAYRIKPIIDFHKILLNEKASLIQQWWRALMQCQLNYYLISKIQGLFKGFLCRKVKQICLHQIKRVLPFLYKIFDVYYKNRIKYFYVILFKNFALKYIAKHAYKKCVKIQNKFRKYYLNKRVKNDKKFIFSKNYKYNLKFKNPCVFKKIIFDNDCNEKIKKIQSIVKGYLLRNNEKIMRKIGYNIHPYLYFNLKYNKNIKDNNMKEKCNNDSNSTDINEKKILNEKYKNCLKKKLSNFHKYFNKLKIFNLKVNKKLNNEYEFFKKILQKKLFIDIQNKYENLFNNKKMLKNLIEKKLKKFFIIKWLEKEDKINNLEKLIKIKNNNLCNQKIKYLKKKILKFEKEKILNNLEKNLNKIILRKILVNLMLNNSKKYNIKIVFSKIIKRIFKEFFNKLNYYYKIKLFYNKLFISLYKIKYFKKWSNLIYNKNKSKNLSKYFNLLKIKRLLNKNHKKLFIKKYIKKWKEKINNNNQEENLNKINKKYLLLIKLKQWKEISKFISLKNGKLKKIIINVNKINNKFFEEHCVKYFYDKWHLYSLFYTKYLNEFEKLKIRFFVNILFDSVINKKYLKNISFFIRKLSNNKIINSYLINNKDENFNKEINNNFYSQNSNDEFFIDDENNNLNEKNISKNFDNIENKNKNLIYKKNIIKNNNNEFHKVNNNNILNNKFKENNENETKQNEFQQKLKINLLKKLISNYNSQNFKILKKYFFIFKKNLSMNYIKIFHSNIQINFLFKKKKYLINKKYRMLKYIIFKINNKMKNKTLKKYLYTFRYKIIKLSLKENKNYKYISYIIFLQKKIKKLIENKKI